jgi:3-methyl-2-oxobutanoate hydroxymethyltransferase
MARLHSGKSERRLKPPENGAFGAVAGGADAVITAREYEMVRILAAESIPVVGHVGFVPRKSTWVGSVRAVGKTAAEALDLWD